MGEVDLFHHAQLSLSAAERSLLEALAAHLAGAMENLRLNALEREQAVAQERTFIARELHDSIAQSLAFLKIQVQLMRDALAQRDDALAQRVLAEIDTGVRESYGDVRELLVHFRTRAQGEDIEPALKTTLRKFEHQSGLPATIVMEGHGMPLSPDLQIQVLHIVQEALSNVRKHANASRVALLVAQQPQWRFEVRDDGVGFDNEGGPDDETHVGLRIMAERAERIGATLDVVTTPGRGTSIVLTLPPPIRRRRRRWRRPTRPRCTERPSPPCPRSASSSSTTTRCSGAASPRCSRATRGSRWSATRPTRARRCGARGSSLPTSSCSTTTCRA